MFARVLLTAVLCLPVAAWAQGHGSIDVYLVPAGEVDVHVHGFGTLADEGLGIGIKGMAMAAPKLAITGELQRVDYDFAGEAVLLWRVGAGYVGETGSGAFLEYISEGTEPLTGSDTDGIGLQLRLARSVEGMGLVAQVGYLVLEDDFEDLHAVEVLLGASLRLGGNVTGFFDVRRSPQNGVDSEFEAQFTDIRLGTRFEF
jgi:hypothetical protein